MHHLLVIDAAGRWVRTDRRTSGGGAVWVAVGV
jgi:hypothetical protein